MGIQLFIEREKELSNADEGPNHGRPNTTTYVQTLEQSSGRITNDLGTEFLISSVRINCFL